MIVTIDRRITDGFNSIWQQGRQLQLAENVIQERFNNWAINTFTLRELRVIAVTTTDIPTSGVNKIEYAHHIWQLYKILCSQVLSQGDISNITTDSGLIDPIDINLLATTATATDNDNDNDNDDDHEITWSIDRTPMPSRRHDIEMMSLPNIRTTRARRVRERRMRDAINYIPNPEFTNFMRNLMNEFAQEPMDLNADFIPFNSNSNSNTNKKFKINIVMEKGNKDAMVEGEGEREGENECCICMDDQIKYCNIIKLNCQHQFCSGCIATTLKKHNRFSDTNPCCALCRVTMTQINVNDDNECITEIAQYCEEC
jgi:hypothetical protein